MRYFFLLLSLALAAPQLRAEVQMPSMDCDTIITVKGQVLLVTFVSQDAYEIHYQDCDGLSEKTHTINRSSVKALKLTKRDYIQPARGVPKGAAKWYSFRERTHRKAMSVLAYGGFGFAFSILAYILAALALNGALALMISFIALGLIIAALIKGARFLSETKPYKDDFNSERKLAIAGMVLALSMVSLMLVLLFIAFFLILLWGF